MVNGIPRDVDGTHKSCWLAPLDQEVVLRFESQILSSPCFLGPHLRKCPWLRLWTRRWHRRQGCPDSFQYVYRRPRPYSGHKESYLSMENLRFANQNSVGSSNHKSLEQQRLRRQDKIHCPLVMPQLWLRCRYFALLLIDHTHQPQNHIWGWRKCLVNQWV